MKQRKPKDVYFRDRLIEALENGRKDKAAYFLKRLDQLLETETVALMVNGKYYNLRNLKQS